jgi:predicted TIM-barrel fold metal-dependent hydrolase
MIIDFHIHVSRPEHEHPWTMQFMEEQLGPNAADVLEEILTPGGIRTALHENGIEYGIALAEVNPITTGTSTNEYTADFVQAANAKTDPVEGALGRLIPFASLNPFIDTDLSERLEFLVEDSGFRGAKVYPVYQHHYANDPRMYPLYSKAQELGIPILVHTGSSVFRGARIKYGDPLHLDDVAIDFPALTILMAHSGRPFWYEQAFWMARRHRNVYLEISGLPAKNLLQYFPRLESLADKVVYGSDWPGNPDFRRNIDAILNLPIAEENKAKILGLNASKILGLPLSESVSSRHKLEEQR